MTFYILLEVIVDIHSSKVIEILIPAHQNFKIIKKASFEYTFQWLKTVEVEGVVTTTPEDISEMTGECLLVNPQYESDIYLTLTTENDGLIFGSEGTITINITDEQTSEIEWKEASYLLLAKTEGETYALLEGRFTVR